MRLPDTATEQDCTGMTTTAAGELAGVHGHGPAVKTNQNHRVLAKRL